MQFDKEYDIVTEQGKVPYYGIVEGNDRLVLIKAGAGGGYKGYENKYVRMARLLNSLWGCTVITASNPMPVNFLSDIPFIEQYLESRGMNPTAMHYIGTSGGATVGLTEATTRFRFESMLLINMPLMLNFHKTKRAIAALPQVTRLTFVYGEQDPSKQYVPFLQLAASPSTRIIEYPAADHNFTSMTDQYVSLAKLLLDHIPIKM